VLCFGFLRFLALTAMAVDFVFSFAQRFFAVSFVNGDSSGGAVAAADDAEAQS
jgi:hypothetical protein